MTRLWLTYALLLLACLLAATAFAAERVFTLEDHANLRDWGPELVTYHLTSAGHEFREKELKLTDVAGKAVPFQLAGVKTDRGGYLVQAELSFVARLPKGGSYRYTLAPSVTDESRAGSTVTLQQAGASLEVGNRFFTLRLPAPSAKQYTTPVDVQTVPAPLAGWKRADGAWCGTSAFFTERKVASYTVEVSADGPVYKQIDCRYTFEPAGEYLCSIRVVHEVPLALFTEEFNFNQLTAGRDFLVLSSGPKVNPTALQFMTPGEDSLGTRSSGPLAAYLAAKRKDAGAIRSVTAITPPKMVPIDAADLFLEHIVPGATFGIQGGVELLGGPNRFSVVPLFAGSWRHENDIEFWYNEREKFKFYLPISVRLSHWYMDMADDESPFSTHEHDPGLPISYGRRVWGLNLGDEPLDVARTRYGFIGLDRLKEWVLSWKDDQPYTFPRGWFTPAQVEEAKQLLPGNALAQHDPALAKLYPFDANRDTALAALKLIPSYPARWVSYYPHYRHAYDCLWTQPVDLALSCPDLPADQLNDARAKIAYIAYGYAEPDFNLRGDGGHEGTNNMPINRNLGMAAVTALIPGHPKAKEWRDTLYEYTRWKMGAQTDPCGTWLECPSYMIYGPTRFLHWGAIIAKNAGYDVTNMTANEKGTLEYLMNLTVPDPRYGVRIIPGMGNGAPLIDPIFGQCIPLFQDTDPAFAGKLQWMHAHVTGGTVAQLRPDWSARWSAVKPINPKLQTAFFPGYGVIFRAHFGNSQETVMLFRQGYVKGHWDTDDGNIMLYARGKPLLPGQSYQYGAESEPTADYISYNRVKLGTKGSVDTTDVPDIFGRVEKNIQDYGFLPGADYARGMTDYPAGLFAMAPKGTSAWNRHVLFIKSAVAGGPDYFVMRDTFSGAPRPSWWHIQPLSTKDQVTIGTNTLDAATDYGMNLHIWFAGERPLQATTYPYKTIMAQYGADAEMTRTWAELVPNHPTEEVRTIVQLAKPAGEDYFYVLYPHKTDEQPADCTALGTQGIKITTSESTDYVFVNDDPVTYNADGGFSRERRARCASTRTNQPDHECGQRAHRLSRLYRVRPWPVPAGYHSQGAARAGSHAARRVREENRQQNGGRFRHQRGRTVLRQRRP